jgi:PadR family transcriptional regulator, regulatory protein PadR
MREPTYFVLASLLEGPGHGYAIIQRTTELSQGRVTVAVGTLYGALDRLVNDELVRVHSEEVVDGRFRRSYELTDAGRSALTDEAARMSIAATAVLSHAAMSTPKSGKRQPSRGIKPA